ncbi:hypothetical protein C5E10_18020 [Pseudoclavibacter sp. RFBG4]|uniref:hypothetical protein n=1 Tax=Pseudoclavibacter sp. RFBG4 TaxID=2080575 RepID=UPI000CE931B9|nr:hypothetical protein [Pseudoclavibacter sp. RFBG4]PPG25967.1 hypothetical protein C5E10_18020 [Pseudoclavibacter sp. RFBG4]
MRQHVARLEGVEFRNRPRVGQRSALGLFLDNDGVTNWDARAEIKGDDVELPGTAGEFSLPTRLLGKNIALSGLAVANSPRGLAELNDRFVSIGYGGKHFRIVVESMGRTLWGMAKLVDDDWVQNATDDSARFLLQLRMSDPRRFGEAVEGESGRLPYSSESLLLINRGTWHATPTIRVRAKTNMLSGYTLHGGAEALRISAPLPAGQVHEVDMRSEYVRRNGLIVSKAKHSGRAWHVPPNGEVMASLEPHAGTGEFSPYFLPTYQ